MADDGRLNVVPAAGGGQRAHRAALYQEDYYLVGLLKGDNRSREPGWEQLMEQEVDRYAIDKMEWERYEKLPVEYVGDEYMTGTNTELLKIYDAMAVLRCETLIMKAKWRKALTKDKVKLMKDKRKLMKELLDYAKEKRKEMRNAGAVPLPIPDRFS